MTTDSQAGSGFALTSDALARIVPEVLRYFQNQNNKAGMSPEQASTEIRFRAMRNALGSNGQRGETDLALLPSPLHDVAMCVLLVVGLPAEGDTLLLSRADGAPDSYEIADLPCVDGARLIRGVGPEVVAVQVNDRFGRPIRFGIPRIVASCPVDLDGGAQPGVKGGGPVIRKQPGGASVATDK
jgi:hypothetical protein